MKRNHYLGRVSHPGFLEKGEAIVSWSLPTKKLQSCSQALEVVLGVSLLLTKTTEIPGPIPDLCQGSCTYRPVEESIQLVYRSSWWEIWNANDDKQREANEWPTRLHSTFVYFSFICLFVACSFTVKALQSPPLAPFSNKLFVNKFPAFKKPALPAPPPSPLRASPSCYKTQSVSEWKKHRSVCLLKTWSSMWEKHCSFAKVMWNEMHCKSLLRSVGWKHFLIR